MVRALNGLPLVVRTLDIGGDKQVPYIDLPAEEGSFLGIRGIRLCLARPDLFHTQLRAIYRASRQGPVSIMFPMVARLEDLDAAVDHAEGARAEVGADPVDVGRDDRGAVGRPDGRRAGRPGSTSCRSAPTTSPSTCWPWTAPTRCWPARPTPCTRRCCA